MRPPIRIACGILALAACVIASAQTTQPIQASKFLRFVDDGRGGGALQASVVTYRNARGATVDLIAAVHVADRAFFADLDKSFARYDALLYEMVKPKDHAPAAMKPGEKMQGAGWIGFMQQFLKNRLQLTFQLEQIDYTRKNFVHADLDVETFTQMQEDRGESMLTLMIRQMIHEMGRESSYQPGVMDLLKALQSPDSARQLKLILARQFSELDEMLAGFDGPDGTVIVTERNKAAINVLKKRLAAGDRKIGIFYGAAHLNGLEKILTQEMGFKQLGPPRWRTAWDMTVPTTQPATQPTTRP